MCDCRYEPMPYPSLRVRPCQDDDCQDAYHHALPYGLAVHCEDWHNGVLAASGEWSYPVTSDREDLG